MAQGVNKTPVNNELDTHTEETKAFTQDQTDRRQIIGLIGNENQIGIDQYNSMKQVVGKVQAA